MANKKAKKKPAVINEGPGNMAVVPAPVMPKGRFARMVIYANYKMPLSYELHSVPADLAKQFVEDIEAGKDTAKRVVLEYPIPNGVKYFALDSSGVISVDIQYVEFSGKAAPVAPVEAPKKEYTQ